MPDNITEALYLLTRHKQTFYDVQPAAAKYGHPVPMDTRAWSQILVSAVTGISGLYRKKGADLQDGSDVKGANTWEAIDTPRFNGVLKAGTNAVDAGSIASLDDTPYLFFVLWDEPTLRESHRCRIWAVRTQFDEEFRAMGSKWFELRSQGAIISNNFQLHPPRGRDANVFRNKCGNLEYPLLFCAEAALGKSYELVSFDPDVLVTGKCIAEA